MHSADKARAGVSGVREAFLISLPRSGSTLLQKMLAVSPQVCTVAEPWLMLPLAAMTERSMLAAEYWHETCHQALADLAAELPGGRDEFDALTADFARRVYGRIAEGRQADLFLDKTPRYYMIVPFLARAFPDARFVFLFRDPVEVLSSILRTWHKDRFGPTLLGNYVDIARGPRDMVEGFRLLGDRALGVQYSRLVSNPETVLREVCAFLDLGFQDEMVTNYRDVTFSGRMGDPTGVREYGGVSTDSLAKWKRFIRNPVRKRYVRRYLRDMGPEVLSAFGLDMHEVLREVSTVPTSLKGSVSDWVGLRRLRRALRDNLRRLGPRGIRRYRKSPPVPYG